MDERPKESVAEITPADPAPVETNKRKPAPRAPGVPAVKRRRSVRLDGTPRKTRSDKWVPDEKQLASIEALGGIVKSLSQIAQVIGIHPQSFIRSMREFPEVRAAIERGRALANMNVGKTVYELATKDKHFEAAKFWLKARAGWRDVQAVELGRGPDYENYSDEDLEAEICEQERILGLMEPVEGEETALARLNQIGISKLFVRKRG